MITAFAIADSFGIHAQIYEEDTVVFRKANAFTEQYTGILNLPFIVDPNLLYRPLDNIPKVLFAVDPEGMPLLQAIGGDNTMPRTVVLNRRGEVVYNEPRSLTPEMLNRLLEAAE